MDIAVNTPAVAGKTSTTAGLTAAHACYFAHELSRQAGDVWERLSRSVFDACVDINPHQIDAAKFVLRSPLSKGVILADEVGLGKTIEAGLILCQYWAEKKRRLLVICPASLRKQWALELQEKFNLPARVLDARAYRQARQAGADPLADDAVIILSYHYASALSEALATAGWNLAVFDEAHKLRNAHRSNNVMGQRLKTALHGRQKILLTATPMQNSLEELYGLATLMDDELFGDLPSFKTRYMGTDVNLTELRQRIKPYCQRTLRRQVLEFIRFTKRSPITQRFTPTNDEQHLYEAVSEFLRTESLYSMPASQRALITIVIRKLLASSPLAVADTLESLRARLTQLEQQQPPTDIMEALIAGDELPQELLDDILDDRPSAAAEDSESASGKAPDIDPERLRAEMADLGRLILWARSIKIDTKSRALLSALAVGFDKLESLGAARKAVIFTESKRTQRYLLEFLEGAGYAGRIVTFNGTNSEPSCSQIYQQWQALNATSGRVTGSRDVDMRTALIEHFRHRADIMIATEAGAEGINLQFCSLVVNYDMPWNPQRVEQRIGRCHRYGQKHDVVVINFLNERNAADQRVYELLQEKFRLFDGVFGASDEVLGSIESGVNFEQRVNDIYQNCRTEAQIEEAFAALRAILDESIQARLSETRQTLMEDFDQEVHQRLRVELQPRLDAISEMFWQLTEFVLADYATSFDRKQLRFTLHTSPLFGVEPGVYHFISKEHTNEPGKLLYRLTHPLGEYVLETARSLSVPLCAVDFLSNRKPRISVVEQMKGQTGWLTLKRLRIDTFDREELLLFSGCTDSGVSLDPETAQKLFAHLGRLHDSAPPAVDVQQRLALEAQQHVSAAISRSMEASSQLFNEKCDELDQWADEMIVSLELTLQDLRRQIAAVQRKARQANTLDEKRRLLDEVDQLEKLRRQKRHELNDSEDAIAAKRVRLIDQLKQRMEQRSEDKPLFTIRWQVS